MTQKGFRRWFEAGFGPDLLPIIPVGALLTPDTKVKAAHLGKVPGVLTPSGTWSGLGGKWSDELIATVTDCKKWIGWGASVGLQSRQFVGLDIDVDDATTAAAIQSLAEDYLGLAPARTRAGSARRLLMYRVESPLRKVRQEFGAKQAVELLAKGQQYVVEGQHPAGGEYAWVGEHPCDVGPDNLPMVTAADVERFFDALRTFLVARGEKLGKDGGTAVAVSSRARKSLDDPSLHAPSPAAVLDLLATLDPTRFDTRDALVQFLAPIKAALGPARGDHWPAVLDWALQYPGAEEEFVAKIWESIQDAALGWDWLVTGFGDGASAQTDFDDGGAPPVHSTLESMLSRYVYSIGQDRYYDLETGDPLTGKGFNSLNTAVAQFGRSGVQSAEGVFQNEPGARKVATVTYRPGAPALVDEVLNGVARPAVNLWRPSDLQPAAIATDADVAPWLNHVSMLFGKGTPAHEHVLNYLAFILQHPGVKINHAPVILGVPGIGKDTMLVPFLAAIGSHNYSTVGPEDLLAPFNPYIERLFIIVNEMLNFQKREMNNKIKPLLASPPYFLQVNRKNIPQYFIPNIQNVLMFTNYDDAISIDEDDRRYWVHRCLTDEARGPAYFQPLYNWYASGACLTGKVSGNALVARWLLSRDVSSFSPKERPAMTVAKQEMIEGGLPAPVKWLATQFETGGAFCGRTILGAFELIEHARNAFDAPAAVSEIKDRHAVAALKRASFVTAAIDGGEVTKFKLSNGKTTRLWTTAKTARMDHAGVVKLYESEIEKAPRPRA